MELLSIRYFLALAETESVSKLAQQLNVTSPAISKTITKLEAELGVNLFESAGRGIRLTETGKELYGRIKPLFDEFDLAIKETMWRDDVGVIINIATAWSDMLVDFRKERSDIRLRTTVANYQQAKALLATNDYDFWITTLLTDRETDSLDVRELCTNSITLVVHESHPLARRESVSLLELKDETFLFPEKAPNTGYDRHLCFCREAGFEPRIVATIRPQTRIGMVARNEGVTFLESIENSDSLLRGIELVRISDLPPGSPCYICTRKGRRLSPNAQDFLNFALRYYQKS